LTAAKEAEPQQHQDSQLGSHHPRNFSPQIAPPIIHPGRVLGHRLNDYRKNPPSMYVSVHSRTRVSHTALSRDFRLAYAPQATELKDVIVSRLAPDTRRGLSLALMLTFPPAPSCNAPSPAGGELMQINRRLRRWTDAWR
jgi:hypothetical protein